SRHRESFRDAAYADAARRSCRRSGEKFHARCARRRGRRAARWRLRLRPAASPPRRSCLRGTYERIILSSCESKTTGRLAREKPSKFFAEFILSAVEGLKLTEKKPLGPRGPQGSANIDSVGSVAIWPLILFRDTASPNRTDRL